MDDVIAEDGRERASENVGDTEIRVLHFEVKR